MAVEDPNEDAGSKGAARSRPRRWQADSETDLSDFCRKEGIPFVERRKGAGILNYVGDIITELYYTEEIKTIGELTRVTKAQFLSYGDFYGRKKRAEKCWRTANNILRRHGFRMYVKGRR